MGGGAAALFTSYSVSDGDYSTVNVTLWATGSEFCINHSKLTSRATISLGATGY